VRALVEAEAFATDHADEARDLVAERLGNTDSEFNTIWAGMALETSLGHSLLVSLEDEARWAIGQGLVEGQEPPDYFTLFYIDAIKQVKPGALTVIQ
jgi:NitT/TauT family transport system substrate-binding protein